MGPSKLFASLRAVENQLILSSAVILFRETSVGWRKGLKKLHEVQKRECKILHLGQISPKKQFAGKQLCRRGIEKIKTSLGSV